MIAALGAKLNVVQIQEIPMPTAWHDAPPAIPPHDGAPHGRRNILPRA
jgi:hypothetical protein